MNAEGSEICFTGLHGSTLLGFMAALGAFRTLCRIPKFNDTRLGWITDACSYLPVIRGPQLADSEAVLVQLHEALARESGYRAFTIDKDLKVSGERFRAFSTQAVSECLSASSSFDAEMASAYGCDIVLTKDGYIEDTAFRTMSGAGHQHFLESMDTLVREMTLSQLREALYESWQYRDGKPSMRWDSEDDRRYALRWDEPSGDPVRSVRGANRLAIAALSFFPVVPTNNTVATTGFQGKGAKDTFISWPIWESFLNVDSVRSSVSLSGLHKQGEAAAGALRARGIVAVYRSQRITLGKFRNFTPAEAI